MLTPYQTKKNHDLLKNGLADNSPRFIPKMPWNPKGTTTTTTIGQNISLDVAPVVEVITSEVRGTRVTVPA